MICLAFLCSLAVVWGSQGQLPPPGEHPDHPKCFKFPVCKKFSEECTFPMKEATHIEYYNQTLQQFGMARFLPLGSIILLDSRNTILFKFHMSISKGKNPAMRIFVKGCDQIAVWRHFFDPKAQYVSPKLSIEEGRVTFGENGPEFGRLVDSCASYVSRMAILGGRPRRLRHKLVCLQVPWAHTEGKFIDKELAWLVSEEEAFFEEEDDFPFPEEEEKETIIDDGHGSDLIIDEKEYEVDEDGQRFIVMETDTEVVPAHEEHGPMHFNEDGNLIRDEEVGTEGEFGEEEHRIAVEEEEIMMVDEHHGSLNFDEEGHLIHDEKFGTEGSGEVIEILDETEYEFGEEGHRIAVEEEEITMVDEHHGALNFDEDGHLIHDEEFGTEGSGEIVDAFTMDLSIFAHGP